MTDDKWDEWCTRGPGLLAHFRGKKVNFEDERVAITCCCCRATQHHSPKPHVELLPPTASTNPLMSDDDLFDVGDELDQESPVRPTRRSKRKRRAAVVPTIDDEYDGDAHEMEDAPRRPRRGAGRRARQPQEAKPKAIPQKRGRKKRVEKRRRNEMSKSASPPPVGPPLSHYEYELVKGSFRIGKMRWGKAVSGELPCRWSLLTGCDVRS